MPCPKPDLFAARFLRHIISRRHLLMCVGDQDTQTQQSLLAQIYNLVSQRPSSACNFLPLPPLLSQGASQCNSNSPSDARTQITYRTYASLSFILISTSTESALALIDLIELF